MAVNINKLQRETIAFTTREVWLHERSKDLTSTEIAALFGCSPWITAYELWHYKAGILTPEFEETERMRWGKRLEHPIALGLCEDNGWTCRPNTDYMRIPKLRLGASFDFRLSRPSRKPCNLETKNVDAQAYREGWQVSYSEDDDGNIEQSDIEAPPHMELQFQQQMLINGDSEIVLGALVGGNTGKIIEREADRDVHLEIIDAAAEFWASVKENRPPDPDFRRDSDTIRRLHPHIVGEPIALVEEDRITKLMREHRAASGAAKRSKEDADAFRTEIMHLLGDLPGAKGPAGKITRFAVAGGTVSYERKPRIDLRITHSKD